MPREIKAKLDLLNGKIAPYVIALLCVGAIGSGVQVVRSVDRLEVKLEKINQVNQQQDARLNRHDSRLTWLERQRRASMRTLP